MLYYSFSSDQTDIFFERCKIGFTLERKRPVFLGILRPVRTRSFLENNSFIGIGFIVANRILRDYAAPDCNEHQINQSLRFIIIPK